nr:hypothetical protein B0A51_03146 [Rachicladosporium sp. CCFEE 5018]
MAHQAHNIPWNTLVSHFRYIEMPGSDPDIYGLDKPDQRVAILFFARAFADNVRTYAAVERKKYATPAEYRRRSATWKKSDRRSDNDSEVILPKAKPGKVIEIKKVFSDAQRETWSKRNDNFNGALGLRRSTQYIDEWILGDKQWSEVDDSGDPGSATARDRARDRWVGDWTDTIKGLMMEGALVLTPLHERQTERKKSDPPHLQHMDTLFLLAHHPQIHLVPWTSEYDGCCGLESGLVCITQATLTGYLYLNMLFALREAGSPVCNLTDCVIDRSWENRARGRYRKFLQPRPKYMNTGSWNRLLIETCKDHEHHSEIMMFEPFFYPQLGTGAWAEVENNGLALPRCDTTRFEEADIMTACDSHSNVDEKDPLATRDQGHSPRWEIMVADALEQCFYRFNGKSRTFRNSLLWDSYEERCVLGVEDLFHPESCRRKWAEYNDEEAIQDQALANSEPDRKGSIVKPRREGKRRVRLEAHGSR